MIIQKYYMIENYWNVYDFVRVEFFPISLTPHCTPSYELNVGITFISAPLGPQKEHNLPLSGLYMTSGLGCAEQPPVSQSDSQLRNDFVYIDEHIILKLHNTGNYVKINVGGERVDKGQERLQQILITHSW